MDPDPTAKIELERRGRWWREELDRKMRQTRGSGSPRPNRDWQDYDDVMLRAAVPVAGALVVVAALVLAVGHLAARFFSGGWPRYPLDAVPGVLGRFVTHLDDPAEAWEPVNTGAAVPGPVGWWVTFVLVVGVLAGLTYVVVWVSARSGRVSPPAPRQDWAARPENGPLGMEDEETGRLVVGTSGGKRLGLPRLHSLLVVGPAHTGKTSGVAIPALLEWPGPAVVASTKAHLMDETIGWRQREGDVHVYDPGGLSGYGRSGWAPLYGCGTWQGAIRMAQHLTAVVKVVLDTRAGPAAAMPPPGGDLSSGAMSMALAPYLYAAGTTGRGVMDAAEWIEREEHDEVLVVLRTVDPTAAHVHETTFSRPDPARSAYLHAVYQVLSVYGDPMVAATAVRHEIVPSQLLDGGRNTLYLTAPEHDQMRFQPIFATIVRQILTAASDRFATDRAALDPPLLLLLDEAVGVASIGEVARLAATGAPKGVQLVSIFQDLGRFEPLHPNAAELLAGNHRALLVAPDPAGVAGPRPASTPLLPADLGAQLAPDEAALLRPGTLPVRVRLRRWYHDPELRRRAEVTPDRDPTAATSAPATRSPIGQASDYALAELLGTWGQRLTGDGDDPAAAPDRDPTWPGHENLPDNVTPLSTARNEDPSPE